MAIRIPLLARGIPACGKVVEKLGLASCASPFSSLVISSRGEAVDNARLEEEIAAGAARLGIGLEAAAARNLLAFERALIRWNEKVNLTGSRDPAEILEKHLLDSIAALPEVGNRGSLLDIGSGAGFPGIPLKLVAPALEVTLVDSVGKKTAFMRTAVASLGLSGIQVRQLRATGRPTAEGLPLASAVISRALMKLGDWIRLGLAYAQPNGQVLAMLGRLDDRWIEKAAAASGARLVHLRRYQLPFSGAPRAIATFRRKEE